MQQRQPAMSGITITTTGGIAEIVIDPAMKQVSAAKLVRAMTMNGISCARIIIKAGNGRTGNQHRLQHLQHKGTLR